MSQQRRMAVPNDDRQNHSLDAMHGLACVLAHDAVPLASRSSTLGAATHRTCWLACPSTASAAKLTSGLLRRSPVARVVDPVRATTLRGHDQSPVTQVPQKPAGEHEVGCSQGGILGGLVVVALPVRPQAACRDQRLLERGRRALEALVAVPAPVWPLPADQPVDRCAG